MEINYRTKLLNDSIVECPISYKLVHITIGGITFPMDLICLILTSFWKRIDCTPVELRLTVRILRFFWRMKKGEKHSYMG